MQVLIDYLTMTSKIHSGWDLIARLGLQDYPFVELPGRYGWEARHYYRGVSLLLGGNRVEGDICIELSGAGCRTVEEASGHTYDWYSFFHDLEPDIHAREVNVSRLDIAGDDRCGDLEFRRFIPYCKHRRYICKARWRTWTDGDEQIIMFGSSQSDRRLRIYNKALEQGIDDHWMRVEMQMRDDNALSFLLNWLRDGEIGECYAGVLLDFLRFTRRTPDGNHYDRADLVQWWLNFVGKARTCPQLYLDTPSYCLDDVQRFLERQAGSSLRLLLEANNGEIDDIMEIIEGAVLNRRQRQLLDQIRSIDSI